MIYKRIVIEAHGLDDEDIEQQLGAAVKELSEKYPERFRDDVEPGGYFINEECGPIQPPVADRSVLVEVGSMEITRIGHEA